MFDVFLVKQSGEEHLVSGEGQAARPRVQHVTYEPPTGKSVGYLLAYLVWDSDTLDEDQWKVLLRARATKDVLVLRDPDAAPGDEDAFKGVVKEAGTHGTTVTVVAVRYFGSHTEGLGVGGTFDEENSLLGWSPAFTSR